MYERPAVKKLGSLRELTQYGVGAQNDLFGIWLNADVGCTETSQTHWFAKAIDCRGS